MKIMFISDIHGISSNLDKIKERYIELNCEKLVVLGDIYYIGPRNEMKEDYNIPEVKDFLNSFDNIIWVKGNCDSEIDEMVNDFPMIDRLGLIEIDNIDMYITHGHIYNEENWKLKKSILIYGHYHIPFIKEKDDILFINPGSISLPKEDNKPSYLIYENRKFTIYDIYDNIIKEKNI